ncbi:DUF1972 domain-containing protein [Spongorhabdus nitratireducens]
MKEIKKNKLIILGIRGLPAEHGGFETFAEHLSQYLTKKGWQVTVYCQENGSGNIYEKSWENIRLIHVPVKLSGAIGTIIFDLLSIIHSLKQPGLILTLGYNTALFNLIHRVFNRTNIINMDGIEWKRQKWGKIAKVWFWLNERFGCWFGNHLIADHPRIEDHLTTRVRSKKITMIPYGAIEVTNAQKMLLDEYDLQANKYSILIARPEPENSIFEVVSAFSQKKRNQKLVVLGKFDFENNNYHRQVRNIASSEVIFPGAIYDAKKIASLRFYSRFYIHGHKVGGTNPSLVEALGAGCAVIGHKNPFNQWVAGNAGWYFDSTESLALFFDKEYYDETLLKEKKSNAAQQFRSRFKWDSILSEYENLLLKFIK